MKTKDYNKKRKARYAFGKEIQRGKTSMDKRNQKEYQAKKAHCEWVDDMQLVDEEVLGCVTGKLSTFMHESFHELNLRGQKADNGVERK